MTITGLGALKVMPLGQNAVHILPRENEPWEAAPLVEGLRSIDVDVSFGKTEERESLRIGNPLSWRPNSNTVYLRKEDETYLVLRLLFGHWEITQTTQAPS